MSAKHTFARIASTTTKLLLPGIAAVTVTFLSAGVHGEAPYQTDWICQFGTSEDDFARAVSTDSSGTFYVAGTTAGSLDGQVSGDRDFFLRRYASNGSVTWGRQFGVATIAYQLVDIAVDVLGNVLATGTISYRDSVIISQTDYRAFSVKHNAYGDFLWDRYLGSGNPPVSASGVDVGGDASPYIAGTTNESLNGELYAGGGDGFLVKQDADGATQWTRLLGTDAGDGASGVSICGDSVYVAGGTTGALPGESHVGGADAFVAKYDDQGNLSWNRQFGTTTSDSAVDVSTDALGNVYVLGATSGSLSSPNAGQVDLFVRKYNSNGNSLWTRQWGTYYGDYPTKLAVDANGNSYVVGHTFGAFPGQSNVGDYDVFLTKLDVTGDMLWTKQFGTTEYDDAQSVAISENGEIYVSGETLGSFEGASNLGGRDAWIAKLVALPGDYNFDGVVDAADYTVWRDGLGTVYTEDDYYVWKEHFGETFGTGALVTQNLPVPEPLSRFLLLLGYALVGASARRGRRA